MYYYDKSHTFLDYHEKNLKYFPIKVENFISAYILVRNYALGVLQNQRSMVKASTLFLATVKQTISSSRESGPRPLLRFRHV